MSQNLMDFLQASSDMSILDFDIPFCLAFVLAGAVEIVGIIAIMSTVTWQVLLVAIPVTFLTLYVQVILNLTELSCSDLDSLVSDKLFTVV